MEHSASGNEEDRSDDARKVIETHKRAAFPQRGLEPGAISALRRATAWREVHPTSLGCGSEFSLAFSSSFCCVMSMSFSWDQQEQSDAASRSEGGTVIKYGRVPDLIPKQPGNNARD